MLCIFYHSNNKNGYDDDDKRYSRRGVWRSRAVIPICVKAAPPPRASKPVAGWRWCCLSGRIQPRASCARFCTGRRLHFAEKSELRDMAFHRLASGWSWFLQVPGMVEKTTSWAQHIKENRLFYLNSNIVPKGDQGRRSLLVDAVRSPDAASPSSVLLKCAANTKRLMSTFLTWGVRREEGQGL